MAFEPPVMRSRVPLRATTVTGDRTRDRMAVLNQVLLGAVVLLFAILAVVTPFSGDFELFFVGIVAVFAVTGAVLLVPWNRLPLGLLALVPAVDIVAITLMRLANPASGAGLLWVFPAMWLAADFGFSGFLAGMLACLGAFAITVALHPEGGLEYSTFLLPLVLLAVAGTSFLTARRSSAQSTLLDKQARLLTRARDRAQRQEQTVTEVLDAVDFGVIRIAADGTIAVTNEAHARLQHVLGGDPAHERAPYRADGVTPLPAREAPLERAQRGEAFDGEIVWFGAPGPDRVALSFTARRLRNMDGKDGGAVLISRDVTAEREAMRARDDLVASVSHELRTPLTSILGYLDLAIDEESVPAAARTWLEIAERNAERLLGIVADILAASSASQRSVELTVTPETIDAADIVHAAVESLQPRAAERAVVLDAAGVEPTPAYADPKRIRQVVDNLIANAIKYNRDGGHVTIGSTTDGDASWILVRDTGLGMNETEMAGLFERFYRAQSMRGTGMKGTGLGLSISRDIVRAHGGDITVRSSPGVGSTFIVRLPSNRAAAAPAPRLTEIASPPDPVSAPGPRRRGSTGTDAQDSDEAEDAMHAQNAEEDRP